MERNLRFVKNDLEKNLNQYFLDHKGSTRAKASETSSSKAYPFIGVPTCLSSAKFEGYKRTNQNLQQFSLSNNNTETIDARNHSQNELALFKAYANANYVSNEGIPPKTTECISYSSYQHNNPIESSVSHRYGNKISEDINCIRNYDARGFSNNYKNEDQLRSNTMLPLNGGDLRNNSSFDYSVEDGGTYKNSHNMEYFCNDVSSRNKPQLGGNVSTFKPCGDNDSSPYYTRRSGPRLVRQDADVVDDPTISTPTGREACAVSALKASESFDGYKANKNLQQFSLNNNNTQTFETKNHSHNEPASLKGYAVLSNDYRKANDVNNEGIPPKTTECISYSNYQNNNPIENSVSHRYDNNNRENLNCTRIYDARGLPNSYKNEDQLRSNTTLPLNRGDLKNNKNVDYSVNDGGTYKNSHNMEYFRNDVSSTNNPQLGENIGTSKPCGDNDSANYYQRNIGLGLVRQDAEVLDNPILSTSTGGEAGAASAPKDKVNIGPSTSIEDNTGKSKAYKARCGYRKACSTLRKFMGCDPVSLSIKDRHMLSNQRARVRSYEKSYPDSVRPGDGTCDILLVGVAKQPETPAAKACNKAAMVARGVEGKKTIVGSNPRSTTQKVVGKPSSIVRDHGVKVAKPEPRKSSTMVGASVAQRPMASKPNARKATRGTEGFKVPGPSVFTAKALGTYAEVSRGKGMQPLMEDGPSTSKAVGGKNQSGPTGSARSVSAPKRTRSGKEPLMGSKKPRKQDSIGVDPSLRVAVIDRSDPDGRISPANWVRLEGELMLQMAVDDREDGEVKFCGIDWLKGVKVIDCVNKESVRFLKDAIDGLGEFWPGAKLEVIARSLIPLRPIVYVRLLPPFLAPEVVLKLLKKQNKGLNTQVWSVLSAVPCESSSSVEIKVAVDNAALEMLKACEGRLRLGFGTVKFRHPSIKDMH